MNIIAELEARQAAQLSAGRTIPAFQPGDTVVVNVKVTEGERTRVQAYEGVCIARSGGGINESFTVRKISYGEGVERVFPVLSPNIESIKVVRRGKVRRAKLYYLRDRRGKSARIAEKMETPAAKTAREVAKKAAKTAAKIKKAPPAAKEACNRGLLLVAPPPRPPACGRHLFSCPKRLTRDSPRHEKCAPNYELCRLVPHFFRVSIART